MAQSSELDISASAHLEFHDEAMASDSGLRVIELLERGLLFGLNPPSSAYHRAPLAFAANLTASVYLAPTGWQKVKHTLALLMLLTACNEVEQPLHETAGAAGSVGVVAEALTATADMKTKIKQRYAGYNWVETSQSLEGKRVVSGPPANQTNWVLVELAITQQSFYHFHVWKKVTCAPLYGCPNAYVYNERIKCSTPNGPGGPCTFVTNQPPW